jgi:hypothetical protein
MAIARAVSCRYIIILIIYFLNSARVFSARVLILQNQGCAQKKKG